ncbi:unnamed protein product [Paramecium sonneborni]|uniref:Uncharacterized protein n=1 Tax=Paramecium sonneborni TaxID=65129 RepID=A0A8S1R772_9CILI|nr:unnamed protein product [Paramecium sonneborni]
MAPEKVTYKKELVQYIESIITTQQQTKIPQQTKYLKELPLIIKCYEPYGAPHEIPNKGKIVIICGGIQLFLF